MSIFGWFRLSGRSKNVVHRHIDHHPSHRNIHPDGKRPTRQTPMGRKLRAKRPVQSHQHQRQQHHSQQNVRDQDREIHRADPPFPPETHRSDLNVVDDVTNQEQRRSDERRQHQNPVKGDMPQSNRDVSCPQKKSAERVERGVNGGKIADRYHSRGPLGVGGTAGKTLLDITLNAP